MPDKGVVVSWLQTSLILSLKMGSCLQVVMPVVQLLKLKPLNFGQLSHVGPKFCDCSPSCFQRHVSQLTKLQVAGVSLVIAL